MFFAANHVSWLDILVINACRRVRFVAKSDVRAWPIIGWLAARTGTLFMKRTNTRELARVTKRAAWWLRRSRCVAVFPEGTTTDGASVQTFIPACLKRRSTPKPLVWPLAISYRRPEGARNTDVAFVGDQTLVSSILSLLAQPSTQAQLVFTAPMVSSGTDRRALAVQCHVRIARALAGSSLLAPFGVARFTPARRGYMAAALRRLISCFAHRMIRPNQFGSIP